MRRLGHEIGHGQGADVLRYHRLVARQAAMLRRHLSCAIDKAPRRVGENRMKFPPAQRRGEIDHGAMPLVHNCAPLRMRLPSYPLGIRIVVLTIRATLLSCIRRSMSTPGA